MLSVVVVLSVLGLTGVLIARAGRSLDAATDQVVAPPRDVTGGERHELDRRLDDLHAALDRSDGAERSER